jgi:predicted nuclease with TOPRIM domain
LLLGEAYISRMAEEPINLVLEHLRALRGDVTLLREDMQDVKRRLTSLEVAVAQIHGDFAGQSVRIDRLEDRLSRIEQRLEIGHA